MGKFCLKAHIIYYISKRHAYRKSSDYPQILSNFILKLNNAPSSLLKLVVVAVLLFARKGRSFYHRRYLVLIDQVLVQIAKLSEGEVTFTAHVWALSRVAPDMISYIPELGELLATPWLHTDEIGAILPSFSIEDHVTTKGFFSQCLLK